MIIKMYKNHYMKKILWGNVKWIITPNPLHNLNTKKLRQPDRYLDGSTHHQRIFLPRKIKSQCDQASRYNSQFPGNKLQKNILNETRRVQSTRSRIWETLQAK